MLVVHINIVSLQKNFDDLKQFFSQFKRNVDVICLSETRLSDHNLSSCFLPGYRLFYCNSKTKAGGSAIYVSDVIECKQLSIIINTDGCEDVWVELTLYQNKSLIVGSVYRHLNYNIKPFEDAFVNVIKKFSLNQNYIALEDFNINYDNSTKSQNIIDYANHISSKDVLN